MPDKSFYSNSNQPQISNMLREFINNLIEEIVFKNAEFDKTKKKWLKKYLNNEGLDSEKIEKDLIDFIEIAFEYSQKMQIIPFKQKVSKYTELCYINDEVLDKILLKQVNDLINKERTAQLLEEPVIKSFTASSYSCNYGDSVTLNWVVENADKVCIKEIGDKKFSLIDSVSINNFVNYKTFTLIAEKTISDKTVTTEKYINISLNASSIPSPVFTKFAVNGNNLNNNLTVNKGEMIQISWEVKDATNIFINGVDNYRRLSGTDTFTINESRTIELFAVNNIFGVQKRSETKKVKIHVNLKNLEPDIILFSVNGKNSDYFKTTDTKLTFQVESINTDKLELTVNGHDVNIKNLKMENGNIKGKFDMSLSEGKHHVVLKAINNNCLKGVKWDKTVVVKATKASMFAHILSVFSVLLGLSIIIMEYGTSYSHSPLKDFANFIKLIALIVSIGNLVLTIKLPVNETSIILSVGAISGYILYLVLFYVI